MEKENENEKQGRTYINNEVERGFNKAGFSGSEFQVAHFIYTETTFFHRESRQLSASYISNGTNVPVSTVRKCLKHLVKVNAVREKEVENSLIKSYSINSRFFINLSKSGQGVSQNGYTQKRTTPLSRNGHQ